MRSTADTWRRSGPCLVLRRGRNSTSVLLTALADPRLRPGELARLRAKRWITAADMAAVESYRPDGERFHNDAADGVPGPW